MRHRANRDAIERFIAELKRQGRVDSIDVARLRIMRGIADALDEDPHNAQMWKQLREATESLMALDEDADDALSKALADLARAT